jgi:hypothetical protein
MMSVIKVLLLGAVATLAATTRIENATAVKGVQGIVFRITKENATGDPYEVEFGQQVEIDIPYTAGTDLSQFTIYGDNGVLTSTQNLVVLQPRQGAPTGLLAAFLKTSTPGTTKISYDWTANTGKVKVYQIEVLAAEKDAASKK